jgi:polyphosphate glucokinase
MAKHPRSVISERSSTPGKCTLAIDVGGTGLKASVLDARGKMLADPVRVATPYPCPPSVLVEALVNLVKPLPSFDRVSVGFPGVVRHGEVITAPHFGNAVWRGCAFADALAARFAQPVRLLNDADMQGLAAITGEGIELVVTLGTGIGTALFRDSELMPHLELAHHPIHGNKTYNEYLGDKVRKKIGNKKWNRRVRHMIEILHTLTNYDKLYIGGGNAARVTFRLPRGMTIVSNTAGILGGIALWEEASEIEEGGQRDRGGRPAGT